MTRREIADPKLREELGRAVVRLRSDRQLTQRQLAARLQVDPSYLSRVERGQVGVPSDFVDRVAKALELTWDEEILLSSLSSTPTHPDPGTLFAAMELVRLVSLGGLGGRILRQMGVDVEEKKALGRFLARGIDLYSRKPGLTVPVFIDSGSTCAYAAHAMALDSSSHWQVFTNNLLAALYLLEARDVFLLGGRVDREFAASMGTETLDQLEQLMEELHTRAERWSTTVGILSCLAFSARDGFFARRVDPETVVHGEPSTSRHLRLKQILVDRVPRLALAVTSEKLTRLKDEEPVWGDVVVPLAGLEGAGSWAERLKRRDVLTHILLCLPRASSRKRAHVFAAAEALQKRRVRPFVLVEDLFDETSRATRLLTVVDEETTQSLSLEELEDRRAEEGTVRQGGAKWKSR